MIRMLLSRGRALVAVGLPRRRLHESALPGPSIFLGPF